MLVQESNKVGCTSRSKTKETPKLNNFIGKEIFFLDPRSFRPGLESKALENEVAPLPIILLSHVEPLPLLGHGIQIALKLFMTHISFKPSVEVE